MLRVQSPLGPPQPARILARIAGNMHEKAQENTDSLQKHNIAQYARHLTMNLNLILLNQPKGLQALAHHTSLPLLRSTLRISCTSSELLRPVAHPPQESILCCLQLAQVDDLLFLSLLEDGGEVPVEHWKLPTS